MKKRLILIGLIYMNTVQAQDIKLSDTYIQDSIKIENMVEFYTYKDQKTAPTDAVRFKVKITNLGRLPIPNLSSVSSRSKYLKLFYNNKDANDLNIQNGLEAMGVPTTLEKGESDTFQTGYVIGAIPKEDSGIFLWGDPVAVQWKYLKKSSNVITVDLHHRKIIEN